MRKEIKFIPLSDKITNLLSLPVITSINPALPVCFQTENQRSCAIFSHCFQGQGDKKTAVSSYPGLLCRCLQGWATSSSSFFSVHFWNHSGQDGQGHNYSLILIVDMLQLIERCFADFKKITENARRWHSTC